MRGSTRQRNRGAEGGAWAVLTIIAVLMPAVAFGQATPGSTSVGSQGAGADYRIESDAWNGLSRTLEIAGQTGATLEPARTLDYGELKPEDSLVIVYPRQPLNVESLASWVVDGGRLLLADDFGEAGSFLERLDIDRETPPPAALPHEEFAGGKPAVPLFRPDGVHPLLTGVGRVVANHPAVLRHRGGPVVGYSAGGGVVYDMNLGEGKVIVFGDASLLINQMVAAGDNGRLVQNATGYLCRGEPDGCTIDLYVGRFEQVGEYRGGDQDDSDLSEMELAIERFNETVSAVQEDIARSNLLYYLSLLMAAGLSMYLAAAFSISPPRRYSQYIAEAVRDVPAPQSEFEWNVSRFGADRRETNYALPLSILKEIFEELFLEELGVWGQRPGDRPKVSELARRFAERYLQDRAPREREKLEREVEDLLGTFARIPTRHRVFLDSDAYFSDRDLIQLYRRTKRILKIMGLEEEYERRTRTLV